MGVRPAALTAPAQALVQYEAGAGQVHQRREERIGQHYAPRLVYHLLHGNDDGLVLLPAEERPTGTEFYNTVTDITALGRIYKMAKEGLFDIYELGRRITFGFSEILQYLHNGVLPTYLTWCLIGMLVLFIILLRIAI